MPQPRFQNARQLVDEFKKSGEFDRLRRQMLTHFTNSDEVQPLMTEVEEIAQKKLASDIRLEHIRGEQVYSEVMQELERYPMVDKAVSKLAVFKDETLLCSIEEYTRNILNEKSNEGTKLWIAQPPRPKRGKDGDSGEESEDEPMEDAELKVSKIDEDATARPTSDVPVKQEKPDSTSNNVAGSSSFPHLRSPEAGSPRLTGANLNLNLNWGASIVTSTRDTKRSPSRISSRSPLRPASPSKSSRPASPDVSRRNPVGSPALGTQNLKDRPGSPRIASPGMPPSPGKRGSLS